jgi:hypothetical protein
MDSKEVERSIREHKIYVTLLQIKSFDISTLYTTIPHSKLKDKLRVLVKLCFMKRNGQCRYTYLVLGRGISYFVKHHSDSTKTVL